MFNCAKRVSNRKSDRLFIRLINNNNQLTVQKQFSHDTKTNSYSSLQRHTISNQFNLAKRTVLNAQSIKFIHATGSRFDDLRPADDDLRKRDNFTDDGQIDFNNELTKQAYKQELTEFKNVLNTLTLAECLRKYECSIEDALALDPEEQKRIIIKGLVIAKFISKKVGRVKLKLWDTNDFKEIATMMPLHVYKAHSENLGVGSSVVLTGLVFENKETKINSFYCDKIVYVNKTSLSYEHKLYRPENTIMDWFNLRNYPSMKFRSHRIASLIKIRSSLINHIHKLMNDEQFVHVTPPTLTSWPLFGEDVFVAKNKNRDGYFPSTVYLNKECDKHLESIVSAIPQIYSVNHSFSADNTRSKQVANEKLMLDVAQLTDDSIDDLINQVEYFLKKLSSTFATLHPHIMKMIKGERSWKAKFPLIDDVDSEYIRMTYDEVLELLRSKEINLEYGEQLSFHHRKIVSDYFQQNPVLIHSFPYELHNDFDTQQIDNKAQRFELIVGKGLVVGKGKIKSRSSHQELADKLTQLNCDLNDSSVSWYLELRKKGGTMPSTWFSLSLDLYIMALIDLPSLRDAIPFPRVPNQCVM